MPQMAPYSWMTLYVMFTLIMIYLISTIYYIYHPLPMIKKKTNKILYYWKW